MQLSLSFLQTPGPNHELWESLDHEQRQTATDKLSRLIAKAALAVENKEEDAEDGDD